MRARLTFNGELESEISAARAHVKPQRTTSSIQKDDERKGQALGNEGRETYVTRITRIKLQERRELNQAPVPALVRELVADTAWVGVRLVVRVIVRELVHGSLDGARALGVAEALGRCACVAREDIP